MIFCQIIAFKIGDLKIILWYTYVMANKSKKRKFRIYNPGALVAGVFFLMVCLGAFISLCVEEANKNSHGLEITQEFYVDSDLKSALNPKYETKIVGRIKNNNNHVVEDIVLHIEVETLIGKDIGTAKITIDRIEANEEYYVSVTKPSGKAYEVINEMMVQIGDGEKLAIGYGDSMLYTIIGGLTMMIVPVVMIALAFKPNKNSKSYQRDQEIEEIKAEMENKIKKLKKAKYVKCEYCGLKNQIDATRCEGCGATVEYKSE